MRIEFEALWHSGPNLVYDFKGHGAFEASPAATEIASGDAAGEVLAELTVALKIERLTAASLTVRSIRSTWPLVHGCWS